MLESIILGITQGIAEWLPVSSEGLIVLIKTNFFGGGSLEDILKFALFLHLGTFLAAFIYFRHDVVRMVRVLVSYRSALYDDKQIFNFLFLSTIISGLIGILILKVAEGVNLTPSIVTIVNLVIAFLLIVTGFLQLKSKKDGLRQASEVTKSDSVLLGFMQGFAVLPGLSRSGLTVSALLLRRLSEADSLRLSFLMSLPIVLLGNIGLNIRGATFSFNNLIALLFSFVFGLITIHLLLKLAKKINFGYFVLIFAGFLIISVLV